MRKNIKLAYMKTPKTAPALTILLLVVLSSAWLLRQYTHPEKQQLGMVADVTETSSGLVFQALVDTGASRSSINCQAIEIEDESETLEQNIGKMARVLLVNEKGEEKWVEFILIDYSKIRTIDAVNSRYHVRTILTCRDISREITVTLSDRSHMTFRMLLGRNFLKDNFVVDVSEDNPLIR